MNSLPGQSLGRPMGRCCERGLKLEINFPSLHSKTTYRLDSWDRGRKQRLSLGQAQALYLGRETQQQLQENPQGPPFQSHSQEEWR